MSNKHYWSEKLHDVAEVFVINLDTCNLSINNDNYNVFERMAVNNVFH